MATTEKLEESNEETCESVWPPHLSLYVSSTRGYLQLLARPFGQGLRKRAINYVRLSCDAAIKNVLNKVVLGLRVNLGHRPSTDR